jgi:hypothetical protein
MCRVCGDALSKVNSLSPSAPSPGEYPEGGRGCVGKFAIKRRQPKFQCDLESDEGAGVEVKATGGLGRFLQGTVAKCC